MDVQRQLKKIKRETMRLDDFLNWIQRGSGATDALGDAAITFLRAPYPSTPVVFLQAVDAAAKGIVLDVVSKSATGFTVKARKVTGLPTGQALKGMHYTTASAVTSTTATGSALGSHSHTVDSHTHSIAAATTGTFVTGGTDPGHTHTNPNTGSAGDHIHQLSATVASISDGALAYRMRGYASDGVTTGGTLGEAQAAGGTAFAYSKTAGAHTHTQGDTGSSTTGITLTTASAVTGIPSATGSASPGTSSVDLAHTHTIAAATMGTFVTSLVIDPTDWLTVVTGDPVVLAADFDWLSLLL